MALSRACRGVAGGKVILRCAEWPKNPSPEVPGHIATDERPAAHPPRLPARCRQRVLRRDRVRDRALEGERDRGVAGGGGGGGGGTGPARLALPQPAHVDEYVATPQVGITLASIGIGFLGEPAIASLVEPLLEGFLGEATSYLLAFLFAYAVVTLLHVIFGEQAPKMVGIARAEGLLLGIARPLEVFRRLFHPLIVLTNAPARFFVARVLRIHPEADEEVASTDELRLMIVRGAQRGRLDPGEAGMLGGVFHLHEQEAREVMTPIPAVVTVDSSETVETALRRCVTSGHTRLVVIEDDHPDRAKGIGHNTRLH